jgi:DNA-binding winged helix-turn-helix (wHTH) protein/Tfp pilus assembly protein PilF
MARFNFKQFVFDDETSELFSGTTSVPIQPRQAKLLALFLNQPQVLISRDEIIRRVWGEIKLEQEQALNFAIKGLRDRLGDSAQLPQFIETLPRRGYRFVSKIEVVNIKTINNSISRYSRFKISLLLSGLIFLLFLSINILSNIDEQEEQNENPSLATFNHDLDRALYLFNKGNYSGYERSLNFFNKIIEQHPEYGPAYGYAAIAIVYTSKGMEKEKLVDYFIERAKSLSPDTALTSIALGVYAFYVEWDIVKARHYYEQAYATDDTWILLLHEYSVVASLYKNDYLAVELTQKILKIDPGRAQERFHSGWIYQVQGQYYEALKHYKWSLEINPDDITTNIQAGLVAQKLGLSELSIEFFSVVLDRFQVSDEVKSSVTQALKQSNIKPFYLWWIAYLEKTDYSFALASAYAVIGKHSQVLHEIEVMESTHNRLFPLLLVMDEFHDYQADEKFNRLLNRVIK